MATITTLTDTATPKRSLGEDVHVVRKKFSFGDVVHAASDVIQLFKVADYSAVESLHVEMVTVEGSAATAEFGVSGEDITDDPDGLLSGYNLNTATPAMSSFSTTNAVMKNFGQAGGYVTMTPNAQLANCEVIVTIKVLNYNQLAD